ncbi:hypothetical protein A8B98_03660 [Hymenobacter sp. UV11]|nr:hypothetical protein A8B98_03660 [Hymenobacter sp. UV11]
MALGSYLYTTSMGLAGTSDSYHYLYAAHTLRQTGHLLMPDGSPYQAWPPLFPVVLALLGGAGLVHWLNGLALLGAVAAWSAVGYQLLPGRRALALSLLLALGSPALVVSKFIWSEPLFNLLWACYFLALLSWMRRGGRVLGLLATGLGFLLPLQRIAGVFLLAGIGVGLAWPGAAKVGRPGGWARLGHLVGTGSGLLLWQVSSWPKLSLSNSIQLGDDPHAILPILADYGFVLWRWLVPLPAASLLALPAAVWVCLLVGVAALWPWAAIVRTPTRTVPAGLPLLCQRMLFMGLVLSLVLLTGSAARGRIGADVHEAERYLTPLYPTVLLLVLLNWPATKSKLIRLGPVLVVAWVLYQGVRAGHNAYRLHRLPPMGLLHLP